MGRRLHIAGLALIALMMWGGRLAKHARYYWLLLAESHLTRRLFGAMVRRIELLPLPAGQDPLPARENRRNEQGDSEVSENSRGNGSSVEGLHSEGALLGCRRVNRGQDCAIVVANGPARCIFVLAKELKMEILVKN